MVYLMDLQSPEGYGSLKEYNQNHTIISTLSVIIALLLGFLFRDLIIPVLLAVWNNPIESLLLSITDYYVYSITTIIAILVVVVTHEGIHYYVSKYLGYDPDISLLNKYVYCHDQYIDRNSSIIFLISPLLIIDLVALLILLPDFVAILSFPAKMAFAYNTIGSAADIYNIIKQFRYPKESLFLTLKKEDRFDVYYCVPD